MTPEVVKKARAFAVKVHGDQQYKNDLPYIVHLFAVETVLRRFGVEDENIRAAAYLHDVLEDTTYQTATIEIGFGDVIANMVDLVTNPKVGTRKEKHAFSYPRIAESTSATILKVADRIANVEAAGLFDMYVKEYPEFRKHLRGSRWLTPELNDMWVHLDRLMDYMGA